MFTHIFALSLHVFFMSTSSLLFIKILMTAAEIAKRYDPELKPGTLTQHFNRNIKPNAKLTEDAFTRGENPMGVTLVGNVREDGGRKC
jgi:hypothetical protein